MGSWEKTQSEQVTEAEQRDIADHTISWSVYKVGGRRNKGREI